jgi:CDP-glycerol glycerophosphotransferase
MNFHSFTNENSLNAFEQRISTYDLILSLLKENKDNINSHYLFYSIWNQTYGNLLRDYPSMSKSETKIYYNKLNEISKKYEQEIKEFKSKDYQNTNDLYFRLTDKAIFKYSFSFLLFTKSFRKLKMKKHGLKRDLLKIFTYLPLNKKKIFLSSQYGQYNDNSKYLYLEMKNDPKYKDYKFVFAVKDQELIKSGNDFINYDNKVLYYYHHYTSKYIYFNTWYSPFIKKRNKQVFTQLWHGIPIKKVHTDINTYDITFNEEQKKTREKAIMMWDNLYSVNEYNTKIWENLFPLVNIIEKEYPKTKWLIDNKDNRELIKELKNKFNLKEDTKYTLYAPTYRPYNVIIDLKEMEKLKEEDSKLIIHLHPLMKYKFANEEKVEYQLLEQIDDIQELILITDNLITDYSSISYDYQKINKKVTMYQFDRELYEEIHGLY